MSGEAVGFPLGAVAVAGGAAVLGAGVVVAAVVVPGSLAARAIRAFVDGRVEAAKREAEKEKGRMEEWRRGVEVQGELQREETGRIEALREAGRRLAEIELAVPSSTVEVRASTVQGLIAPREEGHEGEALLASLEASGALLDSLGKALESGGESPLPLLHARRRNLEERLRGGERVFGDEVKAFHSLVTRMLRDSRESEERRARRRAELLARLEVVVDNALKLRELAADPVLREEVEPVLNELRRLPATDRLSASRLDALVTHLGSVKQRAESALEELAARRVLEDAVLRHLGEFGYELLEDFAASSLQDPRRARLRVPGGEQIWVTLQANGALDFRLVHEDRAAGTAVVERFLPEFRRQEGKWCADLKRLFSCLAGDGFPYEIRFERTVPEGGVKAVSIAKGEVPVAYWECADEWEEAEGPQERRALE